MAQIRGAAPDFRRGAILGVKRTGIGVTRTRSAVRWEKVKKGRRLSEKLGRLRRKTTLGTA